MIALSKKLSLLGKFNNKGHKDGGDLNTMVEGNQHSFHLPSDITTYSFYMMLEQTQTVPLSSRKGSLMGTNNWGDSLTLPVTTGKGIGPTGDMSPVVSMLKTALLSLC